MTEPMGYNDQFDDLPNEDASWEKMNRLLDEEEKKRRVLPFWLRFSGLCILLIGAAVGGYVMVNGDNASQAVTEADFPERTQSPKPVTTTGAKETNITSEHSETTANTDNKLSPQHRNTTVQAGKQSATETSQDNIEVQKKVTVETASPKKPVTYQNNSGTVSKKTVSRNAGSVVLRDKVQK